MDYESSDSRSKGCWDPATNLTPFLDKWCTSSGDGFVIDEVWCGMVGSVGFGDHGTLETLAFWTKTLQEVYKGEEGRKKAKMALTNLLTRDGLLLRLRDVKCPVHWLQVCLPFPLPPSLRYPHPSEDISLTLLGCGSIKGTIDVPYGTTVPAEQIKLFTSAPKAELTFVPDGGHYLNATNPVEVAHAILKMVAHES